MRTIKKYEKHFFWLWLTIIVFVGFGCQKKENTPKTTSFSSELTVSDFAELEEIKARISDNDSIAVAKYNQLIHEADEELNAGPFSVVHKTGIPPSGDKHDYLSLAPYFWPNPDTPDHLPYIRKDGEVNPETRDNYTDYSEMKKCFNGISTLGNAFYFSGEEKYANKAISLIDTWFVNEATKMNPHLDYGQGIPGKVDGRPFGIIEFNNVDEVLKVLEILKHGNVLPSETEKAMQEWFSNYAKWLQTSEIGVMESTRKNNHGTWYDVQISQIYIFLGDIPKAQKILEEVKEKRIATQIEPDGSQPHELARTKSFSYSTMNLSAFTQLAKLGKMVDVDLWNFETEDGRSIKKAYAFLMPYITTNKEWTYKQLAHTGDYRARFRKLVEQAGKEFNEASFLKITKPLAKEK